ncbi:MAG: hypothetical protein P8130_14955 [Deltaproteobacteria bacterium]
MPIEINDLDNGLGSLIEGKGYVTRQEYINALSKHLKQDQENLKRYRYSISDYTAVTDFDVRTEDITYVMGLSDEVAGVNPDVIVAIVADKDLLFGLSRMFQLRLDATNWELMVFRKREEANAWIRNRVKEKYKIDGLKLS